MLAKSRFSRSTDVCTTHIWSSILYYLMKYGCIKNDNMTVGRHKFEETTKPNNMHNLVIYLTLPATVYTDSRIIVKDHIIS